MREREIEREEKRTERMRGKEGWKESWLAELAVGVDLFLNHSCLSAGLSSLLSVAATVV